MNIGVGIHPVNSSFWWRTIWSKIGELRAWKARGWVQVEYGRLILCDPDGLARMIVEAGDTVTYTTPHGESQVELLDVKYPA